MSLFRGREWTQRHEHARHVLCPEALPHFSSSLLLFTVLRQELTKLPGLALNLQSTRFNTHNAKITGMCHYR